MAPRHAKKKRTKAVAEDGTSQTKSKKWLFLSLGLVAVLGIGGAIAIVATSSGTSSADATATRSTKAFTVVATTPTDNSTVDSSAAIRVSLSAALSPASPLPTLTPAAPGTWARLSDTTLEFEPQAPFAPGQSVTVTVPGGATGLTSTSGAHLAGTVSSSFQVGGLSLLRVQQLLAEEGYLPVTFTPAVLNTGIAQTAEEIGTFNFRWSTLPASLTSQWKVGENNVVTKGAIMRFEDVHNLTTDGTITPQFETALLADRAAGKSDPAPYTYVDVTKTLPETLHLYSNGQVVYTTLVNTGIPGQETPNGTWPVYLRYKVTTMSGTNPDGTPYHDEGILWTSYFYRGDALHGFVRSTYGWPQSLGCVEMSNDHAGVVWPQTPIGTLVTVS